MKEPLLMHTHTHKACTYTHPVYSIAHSWCCKASISLRSSLEFKIAFATRKCYNKEHDVKKNSSKTLLNADILWF